MEEGYVMHCNRVIRLEQQACPTRYSISGIVCAAAVMAIASPGNPYNIPLRFRSRAVWTCGRWSAH
jgi:hypothetical protein